MIGCMLLSTRGFMQVWREIAAANIGDVRSEPIEVFNAKRACQSSSDSRFQPVVFCRWGYSMVKMT